jgi:hypothetical protein
VCHHDSIAARRSAAHRDEPQLITAATRQQRLQAAGMCSRPAVSDHERQMLGRTSSPSSAHLLYTFVHDKLAPRSQPQGGGGSSGGC